MYTNFEFSTVQQVAEEQALLDSGASENLIDKETWKSLGIGSFKLPKPITIYNVDGTENKQGKSHGTAGSRSGEETKNTGWGSSSLE